MAQTEAQKAAAAKKKAEAQKKKEEAAAAAAKDKEPNLHVVTQEDLDANPEWVTAGIEVGQEVDLNSMVDEDEQDDEDEESDQGSADGVYVIVIPSQSEFIRVYENKALAEEFVSKNALRHIVSADTIKSLTVLYDVITKEGVKHETKNFSLEDHDAALALCYENRGVVQYKTK